MAKKDTRSADARALEVSQAVKHSLIPEQSTLQNRFDARLSKVAEALLRFMTIKQATRWLLKKNPSCDNLPPIDLVNSEYATRKLMRIITHMHLPFRLLETLFPKSADPQEGNQTPKRHTPLREQLQGPTVDPGPPPEIPHNMTTKPKRRP